MQRRLRVCVSLAAMLLCAAPSFAQNPPPMTTQSAIETLNARRSDKDALAESLRQWFGADNLKKGGARTSDLNGLFAIEAPDAKEVMVVSEDRKFSLKLKKLGKSDVYAGTAAFPEGRYMRYAFLVGTELRGQNQVEFYTAPPESREQPGVPKGTITQQPAWLSKIFPNTTRDWWVYVPAQYSADKPAAVMIVQDGSGAKDALSQILDNMIAKDEIPVTVAIYINPGRTLDQGPNGGPRNRSFEYDTLSDQYSRFLLEEILPEVEKTVKLRHDPAGRTIVGESSGGICAFTAAWQRPDQFGKVISFIGSFVNLQGGESGIAGGHNYPPMIRKTKDNPKPIRVFLQDGANDLDNPFGNWPLANQEMAAALKYAGYDYKFVLGEGPHSGRHGRSIFPEILRWLWRDGK